MNIDKYLHRLFMSLDYSFPQLVLLFVIAFLFVGFAVALAEKVIVGQATPNRWYDLVIAIITAVAFMWLTFQMGIFKQSLGYNAKTGEFVNLVKRDAED